MVRDTTHGNRTDLAANHAERKDRPKKKARGLATLRPAATLVCADDGGDHAGAPADVWRSEEAPQYPALHMHRRYAEEVAKLDEERQEGSRSRELNRWDVALEIFTIEEAYRLRRIVDKVPQPVNERRETLGLSVHDDDNSGDDVLDDGTALPAGSNGVALLGHGDGGAPCVGNDFVMGVNSNSDVRAPGNGRDRVMQQDDGFLQPPPCSTISMHHDASGIDGYQQQHMAAAMDMYGYGYDYDRIAAINQQRACDVCQQSTTQHDYGFQCFCNSSIDDMCLACARGVQATDGNFAGAPTALPLAMSYGDGMMKAGRSPQTRDPDSLQYLCYPEGMHLQDNSGENNLPSIQFPEALPHVAPSTEQFSWTEDHYGAD